MTDPENNPNDMPDASEGPHMPESSEDKWLNGCIVAILFSVAIVGLLIGTCFLSFA